MSLVLDIVDDILSRLPARSLVRFKGVCKEWCHHIQSHSFIARHTKIQETNEKLLIYHCQSLGFNYAVSICSEQQEEQVHDDDDGRTMFHQSNHQQFFIKHVPLHCSAHDNNNCINRIKEIELVGTCNGLICFCHIDCKKNGIIVALWNPTTRDLKTLPLFQELTVARGTYSLNDFRRGTQTWTDHMGFGYDCTTDDYKVLRISEEEEHTYQMKIYSLRRNTWLNFDCSDVSAEICAPRTLFRKDKFCWVASCPDGIVAMVILLFDIVKEVFRQIPLPLGITNDYYRNNVANIFAMHDSIGVVLYCEVKFDKIFQIWTSKNFQRSRPSWINMANIGPHSLIGRPLGFWKCRNSNDLLFLLFHEDNETTTAEWTVYNNAMKGFYVNDKGQISRNMMNIKVNNRIALPLQVLTYVETLVSVNRS
ncbi:hypothetical protein LIER_02010 [Lithospermum erythrorhizon]|uniref:F-box domain-containing protein n=1 Tax=Lithospermum erythrorhizon TaxID=34254 RepID=A0AAV3NMX1_LITER